MKKSYIISILLKWYSCCNDYLVLSRVKGLLSFKKILYNPKRHNKNNRGNPMLLTDYGESDQVVRHGPRDPGVPGSNFSRAIRFLGAENQPQKCLTSPRCKNGIL